MTRSAPTIPPTRPSHIQNLDALRAIAVLLVMLFHFRLIAVGWIGVSIFFVISGFLITRILLDYRERFGLGRYLGVFYLRRSLRIFPIYYLYVGAWSLVAAVAYMPTDFSFVPLITYCFNFVRWSSGYEGSRIFTHLWSLSVEEQFYLAYPLVVFALGRRALIVALIATVVLSPALRWLAGDLAFAAHGDPIQAGRIVAVSSFLQLDGFAFGGLIALGEARLARLRNAWFGAGMIVGLAVVAGAVAANLVAWHTAPLPVAAAPFFIGQTSLGLPVNSYHLLQHVWVYSVVDLAGAVAVVAILRTLQRPLPALAPLNAIGRVSYGIYLYHFAVISVFDRIFGGAGDKISAGRLAIFSLYAATVYVLAALSYRYIETPFNALKSVELGRVASIRLRRREATS